MNESFILYTSYYAIIEGLTDEQLGKLTRALFVYARDGEQIKLDPVVRMAFSFIKDNLDRNADKYQKKCEKLRANIKKRWEKKNAENTNVEPDTKVYKSIQKYSENTNVYNCRLNDNDNDNDNDNEDKVSNDTMNPNNNKLPKGSNSKSKTEVLTPEPSPKSSSSEKLAECAAIKDYWNEQHDKTNSSMRRLTLMSVNRKTMIRARLRQCKGDVSMLYKAIDMAMASDFMNGNNGRNWVASFDWIFGNENNFAKTLEGYDDKPARPPKNQQRQAAAHQAQEPSIGERYQQAQHQATENKDKELIARYLGMVDMLEKNPNHLCRGALISAYEAGELKRLGIDWRPNK